MKNKILWELVGKRVDEVKFESEDLRNLAKIEMYTAATQNVILEIIKKNVVFISWFMILGIVGAILISLGL